MPVVQSTYASGLSAAFAGMIANQEPTNIISRTLKLAAIGFGKVAVQGANADECRNPDAGQTKYLGITVRDQSVDPSSSDQYRINDTVAILTKGVVWVTAGANVAAGDAVYFVPATGVITNSSVGNTIIPNAKFDTGGNSGALVKLRLA